jgi:hypothetical protein
MRIRPWHFGYRRTRLELSIISNIALLCLFLTGACKGRYYTMRAVVGQSNHVGAGLKTASLTRDQSGPQTEA